MSEAVCWGDSGVHPDLRPAGKATAWWRTANGYKYRRAENLPVKRLTVLFRDQLDADAVQQGQVRQMILDRRLSELDGG